MDFAIFVKDYFFWHYFTAFREGLIIWKNSLWFLSQFFSLGLLLRTLFSPWKRMREYYSRGFDPKQYFEVLIINLIMLFIGFLIRIVTIFAGLLVELTAVIAGTFAFIIWLFLPLVIILCFTRGIVIIF